MGVMKGIIINYRGDIVVIEQDVKINSVSVNLPQYTKHLSIKHVTDNFIKVEGFGFDVLLDVDGKRLYINVEPYFENKVSS